MNLAQRVIEWNKARYDQVFDAPLAVRLLLEETDELFSAPSKIDMLDAVGDITFVAVGVFWKLGFDDQTVNLIMHNRDLSQLTSEEMFEWSHQVIDLAMRHDTMMEQPGSFQALSLAVNSVCIAVSSMRGMGMQYAFYDVLKAICDSNDTKEIKGKVASNIKANISKGVGFIPPTTQLIIINSKHEKMRTEQKGTVQ